MQYAVDNGMLNLAYVQEQIEMSKRKELLNKHPYKIWEGTDGKWHTYLPERKKGRIPRKRNTLEEIQQVVVDYWKQQEENPTIEEIFNEWNDRRLELEKISPSTHLRYKLDFKRYYEEMGKKRINSITEIEIEDFLEEQVSKFNLTAKAFSNLKGITKGFLKRAKKRNLISFNVTSMFDDMDVSNIKFRIQIKEDFQEVFGEEEMPVIMEYLTNNIDAHNLCLLLMFVSGIRIGEAVALKKEMVSQNTIKIRRTETKYKDKEGNTVCEVKEIPKTQAGIRTVVIPQNYEWIIREILKNNPFGEYLFMRNGERLTAQAVRRRLERICKKLNIYHKSPNKIRKTYGSILLDNKVDERMVIQQMGHTNVRCTENHYHRNRRTIEKKTEILNEIPEFKAQ